MTPVICRQPRMGGIYLSGTTLLFHLRVSVFGFCVSYLSRTIRLPSVLEFSVLTCPSRWCHFGPLGDSLVLVCSFDSSSFSSCSEWREEAEAMSVSEIALSGFGCHWTSSHLAAGGGVQFRSDHKPLKQSSKALKKQSQNIGSISHPTPPTPQSIE